MPAPTDAGIDLSVAFGPVYWGFIVSLFLGGMTVVQAYMYFPQSHDRPFVKATAATMLIFDLVSSALVAQSIHHYLLPHFGSLLPLNSVTPELSAECLISTAITLISQLYFVYQLYVVRHLNRGTSWFMLTIIFVSALLAFAGGIACVSSMYIFHHGVLSNRNRTFAIFFGVAKGFGALTDILATIAMCFFLESSKSDMDQSNRILNNLMKYIIERGVLVTLIQTLLLITFYAMPSNLTWFAFHVNVTKLYANTFFAMLNGRDSLKKTSSKSMISSMTHSHTRDRDQYNIRNLESEYHDHHSKVESFEMPTVTRTVVISDL
ncbi:hypothetical protein C8J56DRAFT_869400 [Mycena floridula]|nr:hypothetical protein C8J56DRAFT_869400 [Mycena floridula]